MGAKRNQIYKKRSKFYENRYVKVNKKGRGRKGELDGPKANMTADKQQEACVTPPSSKRLRLDEGIGEQHESPEDYFIMINFRILKDVISNVAKCLDCSCNVETVDVLESRMGLAHKIAIRCISCSWEMSQYSSNQTKSKTSQGRSYFEPNV